MLFEKDPPPAAEYLDANPRAAEQRKRETALLIPCHKSAGILPGTLRAALRIFPPENVFVVANGDSATPLDNTADVCRAHGVHHVWSPVGSKLVAQFVGCFAAERFKYVLMIDDDCALPPDFPVVSDRIAGRVRCVGYTIKSVGAASSRGTACQQAQDLEYKLSGLQRALAGAVGSCMFPHGAISLWDREFLVGTFRHHPGFSISEDWFTGDSCRSLGGRIKMCSAVFVETETPAALFLGGAGCRGGFGEMTVFKQRFLRWNFFFVNGLWYNLRYLLLSWRLGWWEIGTKFFVFQEVYETLLYILTPITLPISFLVSWRFCSYLVLVTVALYMINIIIFNEVHLRLKKERVGLVVLLLYFPFYKLALLLVNIGSCYWAVFKYAKYFAKRHPKIVEDEKSLEIVLKLQQDGLKSSECLHTRAAAAALCGNTNEKMNGNRSSAYSSSLGHPGCCCLC
ncbi:hypothetical protein CDD83_2420 [Cordyceps sp. RAO-2017]|nr:hypothetical protein CDD83_2420 [Cordyceps sp. RAO-2017]